MLGLWKGLGPNVARNAIINAAELASYDQIKVRCCYFVAVRRQLFVVGKPSSNSSSPVGDMHPQCLYSSFFYTFTDSWSAGLPWPNHCSRSTCSRASMWSAALFGCCIYSPSRWYIALQVSLLATGMFQDNVVTHLLAGLGAGFFAVCVGSPVDVVKSRVMGEWWGGGV